MIDIKDLPKKDPFLIKGYRFQNDDNITDEWLLVHDPEGTTGRALTLWIVDGFDPGDFWITDPQHWVDLSTLDNSFGV